MPLPLFFIYNISLKVWKWSGMLKRELTLCRKYIEKGARVSFITYGCQDKKPYPEKPQGIEILYNELRRHARYAENPKILLEAIAADSALIH